MAISSGVAVFPSGTIKEAAMARYSVTIDAMVTIHPTHIFNIEAADEDHARAIAEKAFARLLDEQYGWADYDEPHTEVYKEEE